MPLTIALRDSILQSLRTGIAPKIGLEFIHVGRVNEIAAFDTDIKRVSDNGAGVRFIIGEYGSGKTFFLNLVRSIALNNDLVTLNADLNPDRRLYGSAGEAQSLYSELIKSISTKNKPGGGAIQDIIEAFLRNCSNDAGLSEIMDKLDILRGMIGGEDFAKIILCYQDGKACKKEEWKADALKWLRGEYKSRRDAKKDLKINSISIINDENYYDHLKLMSEFVRLAGFGGMLICIDEMVNIFRIGNEQARNQNYEQIHRILNDLQGGLGGLCFVMSGTPEFHTDCRRGMFSYAQLRTRLPENMFAVHGLKDYMGPILFLDNLTKEDLLGLLKKIRDVYCFESKYLLKDDALNAFMAHCSKKIGDAYFRTPRETITAFVGLLDILFQNPGHKWEDILRNIPIKPDISPDLIGDGDNSLASFKL